MRALVESLDGCAGGRAGEIVAAAGLGRKTCHEVDALGAARLLREARAVAKPVSPKRLGAVGPEGFPGYLYAVAYGEAKFGMKPFQAIVPFVVEAWAVKAAIDIAGESARNIASVSVNRTSDEAARLPYCRRDKSDLNLFGCGLRNTVAKTPQGGDLTLWLNVMTPYMPTSPATARRAEPSSRLIEAVNEAAGRGDQEACAAAEPAARSHQGRGVRAHARCHRSR